MPDLSKETPMRRVDKPTPITPYLAKLIKEAEDEAKAGKCKIFYNIEDAKRYLKS